MNLKRKPTEDELEKLRSLKAVQKQMNTAAGTGDIALGEDALLKEGHRGLARPGKDHGQSPLALAAKNGRLEFVRWGFERSFGKAPWNDPRHGEALRAATLQCAEAAALAGHFDILDEMKRFGYKISDPFPGSGLSCIDISVKTQNAKLFAYAARHPRLGSIDPPALYAIEKLPVPMNDEWVAALASFCKSWPEALSLPDRNGRLPLGFAAEKGQRALIEQLAAIPGIDLNAAYLPPTSATYGISHDCPTPLMLAASHPECVELLLKLGSDPSRKSKRGWNPLRHALHFKNIESAQLIHRARPDGWWEGSISPNSKTEQPAIWSALSLLDAPAFDKSDPQTTFDFLRALFSNAPAEALSAPPGKDQLIRLPITKLFMAGAFDCAQMLIDRGVDINATYGDGFNTLAELISRSRHESSTTLPAKIEKAIAMGAKTMLPHSEFQHVLGLAMQSKSHPATLGLLEEHCGISELRSQGWSTMAEMVIAGYLPELITAMACRSGDMVEEIADWMQAVGAAKGLQNDDQLVPTLLAGARACREKWALHDSAAPGSTATSIKPRL